MYGRSRKAEYDKLSAQERLQKLTQQSLVVSSFSLGFASSTFLFILGLFIF